jgi:hypothetical protein
MTMHSFYFATALQALYWSTEVLRQRRFPKLSALYKEVLMGYGAENRSCIQDWYGESKNTPQDPEDRIRLALRVQDLLSHLDSDLAYVLKLRAWGDYINDTILSRALQHQETLRQKGTRVRLSYRYSLRQVGTLMEVDHKTVAKREEKALIFFSEILEKNGLLAGVAPENLSKGAAVAS